MLCKICPRNCQIDRDVCFGFCGLLNEIKIAKYGLFFFEEPLISGSRGSGTIFFSGCSLKCCYCQNYEISHKGFGKTISIDRLIEIMQELEKSGAHNINFVTPTHFTEQIICALKRYKPSIPIVWNTHGYETIETLEKIAPYVDVFLTDMKYISNETANTYSKCPDYFEVASMAVKKMVELKSNIIDEDNIMKQGVIVRHLVLPLHTDETKDVLDWIKKELPVGTIVSIMSQFTPYGECSKHQEINRRLTIREHRRVIEHFENLGLDGYCQDLKSSSTVYIPNWDIDSE